MAKKIMDIAVKVGEYEDEHGEWKGRYENVGSLMEGDDGEFLILKRTFNPAGVPNPDNRDSLIMSLFEPREREGNGNGNGNKGSNKPRSGGNGNRGNGGGSRGRSGGSSGGGRARGRSSGGEQEGD